MKVLIAEDSRVPRLILAKTLASLGHEVTSSADGDEAWAAYQRVQPEVVISDWLMPGMDGIALCGLIRATTTERYTYFVLLTAMTEVERVITAMEGGADDFIVKPLDRTTLEAAMIAARRVVGLHEQLRDQRAALERLNGLLYDDARRDPLTLLGNRLRLTEDLTAAVARVDRYGQRYCIALLDVDVFKRYNDSFGHPAGDAALRTIGQAMASSVRSGDMVYRYGGDEFLILFPEQATEQALMAVERIRAAVEGLRLPHPENAPAAVVTVSAGFAEGSRSEALDAADWLRRADSALYEAKSGGRNRVVVHRRTGEAA